MAAEEPPDPSSCTPIATAAPLEEAETPQELLQTAVGSAAARRGESLCLEQFILDHLFTACDPEHRGMVSARRVIQYLQEVTGQSGEEGRLRALHHKLDPEAADATLDFPTFLTVMREWIVACQQDGASWLAEEPDTSADDLGLVLSEAERLMAPAAPQLEDDGSDTDTVNLTEAAGLRSRAEQLAARNANLQRDAESAEELNARLAEEVAQLKTQLRRNQQALERAKAAAEDLDDLRALAKGLAEENSELRRQARQLEKEQRGLCSRANGLQEENQQLLAEGHGLRERIQALTAEVVDLEAQLRCCAALLSDQDVSLAQAERRAEELRAALAECKQEVQELRQETAQLHTQLGQMQDSQATCTWCPLGEADVLAQPLSTEIEATCWETGEAEEVEDMEIAAPGGLAGDGTEPAELRCCPSHSRRLLARVLLVALVLLGLLHHGRATWPQLQLQHQGLPPL